MVTRDDILAAHERIAPYINHTPVLTADAINAIAGAKLFFKCENLQKIGAFKARGAMNAALSLPAEARGKGIATHSSGNHAQAIARAAHLLGIKSYIVMPRNVPEVKKKGVLEYGGEIFECEPTLASRELTLKDVIQKTGASEIHPFNNYQVITGQATAAKELIDSVPALDLLFAPVGGGGLLSGTALSVHHFAPNMKVIAGEPSGADDAFRSMQSGKIEPSQSDTIADGLLTTLGDKTFPIIRQYVQEIITVTEAEIVAAMKLIWERLKIIVEPSAAVPLAAVLKSKEKVRDHRIGIILSGGNIDLKRAFQLFEIK